MAATVCTPFAEITSSPLRMICMTCSLLPVEKSCWISFDAAISGESGANPSCPVATSDLLAYDARTTVTRSTTATVHHGHRRTAAEMIVTTRFTDDLSWFSTN